MLDISVPVMSEYEASVKLNESGVSTTKDKFKKDKKELEQVRSEKPADVRLNF